jgi:hypothetical protein
MGQAKNRGSREERVAAALGLQQRPLADIKRQLGLPEDAEFLGYGVHLKDSDEFLVRFDERSDAAAKVWSKDPQHAINYEEFAAAYDVALKCRGAVVVGMFDLGDQTYVAEISTRQAG